MALFEAAVYNIEVRELVANHQHHQFLEDVWAELNFIEVEANDKDVAMSKLRQIYPENKGYEITQIVAMA